MTSTQNNRIPAWALIYNVPGRKQFMRIARSKFSKNKEHRLGFYSKNKGTAEDIAV